MITQLRWTISGAALGLLLTLGSSCGGTVKCSQGCTDSASNTCRSGNENQFCGTAGAKCQACGLGQACSLGTCTFSNNGGGTASNGGGTANNGGGTANNGGGTANNGGGTANNGGGTANNGGGTTNNGGGTANNGGGTSSNGGGGADLCTDGCFSSGICLRNGNNATNGNCGIGGTNCVSCAATNQTCNASSHTCISGNVGGGTSSNGGGTSSNGGGTASNGGGTATNGGGTSTGGGSAGVTVGTACTTNSQCTSLGSGAYCRTQTTSEPNISPAPPASTYSTGFCTLPCGSCPSNTFCAGGPGTIMNLYNETGTFCAQSCSTPGSTAGCSTPGFSCFSSMTDSSVNPGSLGCWDDSISPVIPTGGGTPNKLGNACTTSTQCINSPDPLLGFCLGETGTSGPTGYVGGYCLSTNDDAPSSWCGAAGIELAFSNGDGGANYYCFSRCFAPGGGRGSLRTGYTCRTVRDYDGGIGGVMFPACDSTGSSACGSTSTCNPTTGYCCFSDGGCSN